MSLCINLVFSLFFVKKMTECQDFEFILFDFLAGSGSKMDYLRLLNLILFCGL